MIFCTNNTILSQIIISRLIDSAAHAKIYPMVSKLWRAGLLVVLGVLAVPAIASAQLTSPNYEIDEVFIGNGGELEACGTAYCAEQSAGGIGGESSSANFGAQAGFGTPGEPTLSVTVSNYNVDMGVLSSSSTSAASANFSVANYLSEGYVVRIFGNTPTNTTGPGTHSLTPLNSPNPSQIGVEQFGINLVANSTPGIGANPVQVPDNNFSYGIPAVGYDQEDYFKYVNGDIIAESDQETGQTDYTMSIISNISTSTPGGRYQTILVVQAVAVF